VILDNVFPVFALIALGAALRRGGLTDAAFLRRGDRLVYYVFFPALLLWKVGGAAEPASVPWRLWGAGLGSLLVLWLLSLLLIVLLRVRPYRAGVFSQATYRFNTYVAIAVVFNVQGDPGVARLGELLGLAIPFCNVMAVVTMIWFRRDSLDRAARTRLTLRALVSNPLILACAAGMAWSRLGPPFPVAVDNTLRLTASLTLPFALISIGGSLSLDGLRRHLPLAAVATMAKLLVLPAVGWFALGLAGVAGPDQLTAMLFFAMPASTAMYVLAGQLEGDTDLASAVIVLSTLVAAFTLSAVLVIWA
jgi:predicted permease